MVAKSLKQRVLGVSLSIAIALGAFYNSSLIVNAYTDAQEEMRKNLFIATKQIENIFVQEYAAERTAFLKKVREEGYDETLSMLSFDNQTNPLIGTNYVEIISLYSAIKKYCKLNNDDIKTGLAGVPFMTTKTKESKITENIPALIPRYETGEDGYFHRVGNETINTETVVPIYTEVEGMNGCYEITGTKTVSPQEETIAYLKADLNRSSFEDIASYFGITFDAVSEKYEKYCKSIDSILNPDILKQQTFIELRRGFDFLSEMSSAELNEYIKSMTEEERKIILLAKMFIGQIPYQWGGKAEMGGYNNSWWTYDEKGEQRGLDCSGFVQWVYMTAGYSPDITSKLLSTSIMSTDLYEIPEDQLRPGDIGLLYDGQGDGVNHCGIYVGKGYFIHCSSGEGTVTLSKFPFKHYKSITPRAYLCIDNKDSEGYYDNDYYTISEIEKVDTKTEEIDSEPQEEQMHEEAPIQEEPSLQEEESAPPEDTKPISDEELFKEEEALRQEYKTDDGLTAEDTSTIYMLAQLMTHESLNQGYNGWVAVGEVVRNRVLSELFPNTYEEVILQSGQFTGSSKIKDITPTEEMLSVAKDIFLGRVSIFNNSNVLYFRNPKITNNIPATSHVDWGKHKWYTSVNEHAFYLD